LRRNKLVMALGPPRRREPLYVIPTALALAVAAFAGGALGLVWHKLSGSGTPAETSGSDVVD
jgi:hypothetical protein